MTEPWEEQENGVEYVFRLSCHKFQSHIMGQMSWQDQCSRSL